MPEETDGVYKDLKDLFGEQDVELQMTVTPETLFSFGAFNETLSQLNTTITQFMSMFDGFDEKLDRLETMKQIQKESAEAVEQQVGATRDLTEAEKARMDAIEAFKTRVSPSVEELTQQNRIDELRDQFENDPTSILNMLSDRGLISKAAGPQGFETGVRGGVVPGLPQGASLDDVMGGGKTTDAILEFLSQGGGEQSGLQYLDDLLSQAGISGLSRGRLSVSASSIAEGSLGKLLPSIGTALAVYGLAEQGGQMYQGYKNVGNISGEGAGEGMIYSGLATGMALSPFVSSGQAKEYMTAALNAGFKGGNEVSTVMEYMAKNVNEFGMSIQQSMQLLEEAGVKGGASIGQISASLTTAKAIAAESSLSTGQISGAAQASTIGALGYGASAEQSLCAGTLTAAVAAGMEELGDDATKVAGLIDSSEILGNVTSLDYGGGGNLALMEQLGPEGALKAKFEKLYSILGRWWPNSPSKEEVNKSMNYRGGQNAQNILASYGIPTASPSDASYVVAHVRSRNWEQSIQEGEKQASAPRQEAYKDEWEKSSVEGIGLARGIMGSLGGLMYAGAGIANWFGVEGAKETRDEAELALLRTQALSSSRGYELYGLTPKMEELILDDDPEKVKDAISQLESGILGYTEGGTLITEHMMDQRRESFLSDPSNSLGQKIEVVLNLKGNAGEILYADIQREENERSTSTGSVERNSVYTPRTSVRN